MKKTFIIFIVIALVLISIVLWTMNIHTQMGIQEFLFIAGIIIVVSFAIFFVVVKLKSAIWKEPLEDEFSKKVKTKASSFSFYLSLYLWLFIMYFSDKTKLETHSLIGAGILGMAIIFFLSWVGIKMYGIKNE